MGLNIEDAEAERLAAEVAKMTGEGTTEAVREALRERRDRLSEEPGAQSSRGAERKKRPAEERYGSMRAWLEAEIWPLIPPEELGRPPLTKAEVEEILGIGPEGY
jgi:antitoxin VapB